MSFPSLQSLGLGALAAATAVAVWAPTSEAALRAAPADHALVAVRAGTVHLVEGDQVLEGGATILIDDGKIAAIGKDVAVPPTAHVVDYGPDAVIVPGFVSMASTRSATATDRTAEPGLRAIEEFDFTTDYSGTLSAGVTSVYVSAAPNRLIGGQGAVVKLGGDDDSRTLSAAAAVQGAIDGAARSAPGYWEPPIPATVDIGLGFQEKQLPNTTMGAILALEELVAEAKGDTPEESPYGPHAGRDLAAAMKAKLPWMIGATTPAEIRALLSFGQANGVRVVVGGAWGAGKVASELGKAGADVVWRFPLSPRPGGGRDYGKGEDAWWPDYTVPAALEKAGVRFAIAPPSTRDVLFAIAASSGKGLSEAAALRSVTLSPAEILGVADRVGSLKVGKDADLVVLNGSPLSGQASVQATWVGGSLGWEPKPVHVEDPAAAARLAAMPGPVVLAVDELHVGDGEVLHDAEILLHNGKIREVGHRVSRPMGATVVRGTAAMPGVIDTLGHLGLEGSRRVVSVDYALSQIVAPGDDVDRRVASAGITTVGLAPRGTGRGGSPILAYKPAATEHDVQVVAEPAAVRVNWTDRNRAKSGAELKDLLAKAAEYKAKWEKYEADLAAWTPPKPTASADDSEEEGDDESSEESEEEDDDKKKKKDEEELEPDPVTGVWEAQVAAAEGEDTERLRMRLHLIPEMGIGDVEGNLRCDLVSDTLVELEGSWDRDAKSLSLMGLGSGGWVSVVLTLEEGKLTGTCTSDGTELAVSAERTSKEWVVAGRTRTAPEATQSEEPKGKPKAPRVDARLEPLKSVLEGKTSLLVNVERRDEILACVALCEQYGVHPILVGASDANAVASKIAGRVKGVLLQQGVVSWQGARVRSPWADLQNAGLPVAFHSGAEEGAIDLPLLAAYAVSNGMSPAGALRALTADAADILSIGGRVGRLQAGLDADVLLLDGPPLAPGTQVVRAYVSGREVE